MKPHDGVLVLLCRGDLLAVPHPTVDYTQEQNHTNPYNGWDGHLQL